MNDGQVAPSPRATDAHQWQLASQVQRCERAAMTTSQGEPARRKFGDVEVEVIAASSYSLPDLT